MIIPAFLLSLLLLSEPVIPPVRDHAPVFSPSGQFIAYYSYRDGGLPDLYLFDRVSGSVERLTQTDHLWEIEPAWSPDGQEILYPAGISMRRLAQQQLDFVSRESEPASLGLRITGPVSYSADGQSIFFIERKEDGDRLWRVDLDGIGHLVVPHLPEGRNTSPHATPDGNYVLFQNSGEQGTANDIYILRLSDLEIHQLTNTPWDEGYLSISPDSQTVLFSAMINDTVRNIYRLNIRFGAVHTEIPEAPIGPAEQTRFFSDISADGVLAYDEISEAGGSRIWILEPGNDQPRLLPESSLSDY